MVHRSFQIGPWKVYPASNEIVCLARRGPGEGAGGGRTHLEPKAMDVLTFLSERAGQVVSKDELLAAVWPDVYVSDSTLFRVISELRRALEDSSRTPRFVQTVPKRGYRLVAPVVFDSEAPEATARPVNEAAESPAAARSFIRGGLTVALPAAVVLSFITLWQLDRSPVTPNAVAAPSADARIAYLDGRVFDERADCRSYARARESYEMAVGRDSGFDKPYGELIDAYIASAVLGCIAPITSAGRTAELLAAAARWRDTPWYGIRTASVRLWHGRDVDGAVRLFERAAAAWPSTSDVTRVAGLLIAGHHEKAVAEARARVALAPSALGENWSLGVAELMAGHLTQAVVQFERTLLLYEAFPPAEAMLALAQQRLPDTPAALVTARRMEAALRTPLDRFSVVPALVYAEAGQLEERDRFVARWTALAAQQDYVAPTAHAVIAIALGDLDSAAAHLETAAASGDPWMLLARLDPALSRLAVDGRLARRVMPLAAFERR
jgi:DNA-binding winged helix-turn-helix (wHTH) protein